MVKGREEVISEFNEHVNMTAEELESWLKSNDSNSAGWPKDDAEGEGETVGHDSGRKIVEILQANPEKKEDEYTDDQVEHMRKVVAYCCDCLGVEC
ncbi:DNA-binding protein [Colletotrichum tofieldiae]|nr:DNA-binding protein [Colletotrichum tofieldiae]GKT79745.1 DNA-binding protein [Colletotrichum tofieldiae]GKT84318.1 DNA-binding protein [Colletotrichum tofieldiae]